MEVLLRNRQRKIKVDLAKIKLAAENILKRLNFHHAELSITLTNDKQIRELNRHYRKLDKPTDVLAFSMREGGFQGACPEAAEGLNPFLLGDIIISLETALRQARSLDHSFQQELNQLLIHGILHLLGYDHGRIMKGKEREFLKLISGEDQ